MSGDRGVTGAGVRHGVAFRVRLRTAAEHPLLGAQPRRTRLAIGALAAFLAVHLASAAAARAVAAGHARAYSSAFDALTAGLIAAALLVVLVGPFAYAAWNGGPALAFVVPLAPVVVGELLAGRYVLDLDAAVALTAGAAGAAFALYAAAVRETGSLRPWRRRAPEPGTATFVAAVVVGSGAIVGRFLLAAPDAAIRAYAPFAALWIGPVAIGVAYGLGRRRRPTASRETVGTAE